MLWPLGLPFSEVGEGLFWNVMRLIRVLPGNPFGSFHACSIESPMVGFGSTGSLRTDPDYGLDVDKDRPAVQCPGILQSGYYLFNVIATIGDL